jgi:hypothetical protein
MKAETILETAARIVDGKRQEDYGHPIENHGCTHDMYALWMARAMPALARMDPEAAGAIVVCAFNICQKLSRLANTPNHIDSLADIAGYARNWEMVLDAPPTQGEDT